MLLSGEITTAHALEIFATQNTCLIRLFLKPMAKLRERLFRRQELLAPQSDPISVNELSDFMRLGWPKGGRYPPSSDNLTGRRLQPLEISLLWTLIPPPLSITTRCSPISWAVVEHEPASEYFGSPKG